MQTHAKATTTEHTDGPEDNSTTAILLRTFRPAGFFSSSGQTTTHKTKKDVDARQILWAVTTLDTGVIEATPLFNGLPAPASMNLHKKVAREKFLQQFWPEPEQYVDGPMQQFLEAGCGESYPSSIKATVKAYLPLSLAYLATGQREKAETIIDFMVSHAVPMCDKQKTLLGKIAQELRQSGQPELALQVYAIIRKYFADDDTAVHFSIARLMWDMRKLDQCEAHLVRCLQMDPAHETARLFLAKLRAARPKQ